MTDKSIIIDGIDVSVCECIIEDYQRANNFEGRYEHLKNICELGERGAECYNLFCKDNPNCLYKQLKRKEQENEELKEEIKHYKQIAQYHGNLSVKYTNKSAKLKQTLTEIKEIAKKEVKYAPDGETFARPEIKQILQKISEVI